MNLKLTNFQVHQNSELELKPFTVIVGHSSSGKTSIFRAIKAILFNQFSKQYIKKGSKSAKIELTGHDFSTITMERKSTVQYEIDDKTHGAVGRGQLQHIIDLGFFPIEVDGEKYYPQISEQWDNPFIVSYKDAEVSKLLSELSNTGRIKNAKVQILHNVDSIKDKVSIRTKDRESLQNQMVNLGDVQGQREKLNSIIKLAKKIENAETIISKVEELIEKRSKISIEIVPELPQNPRKLIELYQILSQPEIVVPDVSSALQSLSTLKSLENLLYLRQETEQNQQEITAALSNYLDEFSSLKIRIDEMQERCPTCGQPITMDTCVQTPNRLP